MSRLFCRSRPQRNSMSWLVSLDSSADSSMGKPRSSHRDFSGIYTMKGLNSWSFERRLEPHKPPAIPLRSTKSDRHIADNMLACVSMICRGHDFVLKLPFALQHYTRASRDQIDTARKPHASAFCASQQASGQARGS